MTSAKRVLVVGGGVIGTACAYFLNRAGFAVELIDQGEFGKGCSHANCGLICPSHVLPLAVPSALRSALKALVSPNGALRIKPRLDMALWSWFFQFARRCNTRDMLRSAHAIQALLVSSRRLYDQLLADERIDCEWQARGLLFVFQSRSALRHYAVTDRLLRDSFDLPAERYDGADLQALEPALQPGLAGGRLYRTDAHLRPDLLMSGWRRVLEGQGVRIHEHCGMQGLAANAGRGRALVTTRGEMPADYFVLAAGAWSPLLDRQLGCKLPIQPGKGYSITMSRPARCPTYPLIFEEHRVAVTPMKSGYRLGSTMEFAGYDSTLKERRLNLLRDAARQYLQEPLGAKLQEEWYGWRPMTPDSLPIIDRAPACPNVIIAAGHNMLGLSMAPATGKVVAELLAGQAPHIDPSPYRLNRLDSRS